MRAESVEKEEIITAKGFITSHSSRPVTMVANIREGFGARSALPSGG